MRVEDHVPILKPLGPVVAKLFRAFPLLLFLLLLSLLSTLLMASTKIHQNRMTQSNYSNNTAIQELKSEVEALKKKLESYETTSEN